MKYKDMGIEMPDDPKKIQGFKAKSDVHSHPLFRCKPVDYPWKCKGAQHQFRCFSGMDRDKIGIGKYSYYCVSRDIRYCEACFKYYVSADNQILIRKIISANIRSMPNRLYKFEMAYNCNRLHYYDRFLKFGIKHSAFEITEYIERYQLRNPQIVQIDERYLCLIGGEPNQKMQLSETRKPETNEWELDSLDSNLLSVETFVIIDSLRTQDLRQLTVFRKDLPLPTVNAACGADWKKAIYIVGGEVNGQLSQEAFKFNYNNFCFEYLKSMSEPLRMASLSAIEERDNKEEIIDIGDEEEMIDSDEQKEEIIDTGKKKETPAGNGEAESDSHSIGFFLAGSNLKGNGLVYFYSDFLESWELLHNGNGDILVYDISCSGYPAVKHFNHPSKPNLHYLLIAGGLNPITKEVSKKVIILLVSIEYFQQKDMQETKNNVQNKWEF